MHYIHSYNLEEYLSKHYLSPARENISFVYYFVSSSSVNNFELAFAPFYVVESKLFLCIRNVLLVNSSADHLKVGDFGLSKLIKVQNSHDVYKMTGETGSCGYLVSNCSFM